MTAESLRSPEDSRLEQALAELRRKNARTQAEQSPAASVAVSSLPPAPARPAAPTSPASAHPFAPTAQRAAPDQRWNTQSRLARDTNPQPLAPAGLNGSQRTIAAIAADPAIKPEFAARIAILMQQEAMEEEARIERQRRKVTRIGVGILIAAVVWLIFQLVLVKAPVFPSKSSAPPVTQR